MAVGAALPEIGVTVFVINIRYMLMSLSPVAKLGNLSLGKRLLLANGVTDEIFFLAMQQDGILSGWFFAGLAAGPYLGWVLGTLAGGLAGALLPDGAGSLLWDRPCTPCPCHCGAPGQEIPAVCVAALLAVALACLFRYLPGPEPSNT